MPIYYRKNVAELPHLVGIDEADGSRSSDGNGGFLSFGPHLHVEPGTYFGGFHVKKTAPCRDPKAVTIDATCHDGSVVIMDRTIPGDQILSNIAGLMGVTFDIREPEDRLELRMRVANGVLVNAQSLVIFRVRGAAS